MTWKLLAGITCTTLPVVYAGMSLLKKILTHRVPKQVSSKVDPTGTDSPLPHDRRDEITSSNTSMQLSSDSTDGPLSEEIDMEYKKKRRKLNHSLRKYRKREKLLSRKQKEAMQIDDEIKELKKLLQENKTVSTAMDAEIDERRKELVSLCLTVPDDVEKDAKKEPLVYKKFCNAKTLTDMDSVLKLIEARKTAIKNIEVLAYQKYVSMKHAIELQEKAAKKPPPPPPKPNYDHIFNSIRDKLTFGNTAVSFPWLQRASGQQQQSSIPTETSVTGSPASHGQITSIELMNIPPTDVVDSGVFDSHAFSGFSTTL